LTRDLGGSESVTLPRGTIELGVRSWSTGSAPWTRRLALDETANEIVVALDR
jgi:hypothetical protein